jgi:hypothetical protein
MGLRQRAADYASPGVRKRFNATLELLSQRSAASGNNNNNNNNNNSNVMIFSASVTGFEAAQAGAQRRGYKGGRG